MRRPTNPGLLLMALSRQGDGASAAPFGLHRARPAARLDRDAKRRKAPKALCECPAPLCSDLLAVVATARGIAPTARPHCTRHCYARGAGEVLVWLVGSFRGDGIGRVAE